MSEKLEKLLEELLEEQEKTSLYTLTLERDRLLGALVQAGLGTALMFSNEFSLAPGATTNIVQLVPNGFVYLVLGPGIWYCSLPWWCSYNLWLETTAPSTPVWTSNRMPAQLETVDIEALFPVRGFLLHVVQNNHGALQAYGTITNPWVMVSTDTWDMIRAVYIDPIVADVRKKALEISGVQR